MNLQLSFTELVQGAAGLSFQEYEKFVSSVNQLRVRQKTTTLPRQELDLLTKINRGFPVQKWKRILWLDAKMEAETLTEPEYAELTALTTEYEKYCVQRIRILKKLALIRNASLEETMNQLGIQHGEV